MRLHYLLLSGGVASPDSFQPYRDATQWWGRRDALVRCVSASLFALTTTHEHGTGAPTQQAQERSSSQQQFSGLHIFFSDDGALMCHNSIQLVPLVKVPTEKKIVALWRTAASSSSASSRAGAVMCVSASKRLPSTSTPDSLASLDKRALIAHLQTNCSMDFLRRQHLNSSVDALLKKTNKDKLLQVHDEWCRLQNNNNQGNFSDADSTKAAEVSDMSTALGYVLRELPATSTRVLLLHEDYPDELPVWDARPSTDDEAAHSQITDVVCVLGAVRDMTTQEQRDVFNAAKQRGVPVAGANLGRVAEFTSKVILSLQAHHAAGRLRRATQQLFGQRRGESESSIVQKLAPLRGWTWDGHRTTSSSAAAAAAMADAGEPKKTKSFRLHLVMMLPFPSSRLGVDESTRDDLHPAIQAAVWCLWRSRIASEAARASKDDQSADDDSDRDDHGMKPRLTLAFEDGARITVSGRRLVRRMAERHQAAPCEFQVIEALAAEPLIAAASVDEALGSEISRYKRARVLWMGLGEHDEGTALHALVDQACPSTAETRKPASVVVVTGGTPHLARRVAEEGGAAFAQARITHVGWKCVPGAAYAVLHQWHCGRRLLPALDVLFSSV
ncbi:BTHB domain-containing protein [Pycnococcus provasolii]